MYTKACSQAFVCGFCVVGTARTRSVAYWAGASWYAACSYHVSKSRRTAGALKHGFVL